ncbi:hypothetical protein EBZ37_11060, partial [bacterium]|nr:hypothetical protein [bacterium]
KWAELEGVSTSLKYQNRIHSMMELIAKLRPDYLHGAANRFLGSFYGTRPGFNEKDLKLSREHFQKALRAGPDFFENHVSYAEIYGKKVDNESLVKHHLGWVARTEAKRLPDLYPEQLLEQIRARNLLKGDQK